MHRLGKQKEDPPNAPQMGCCRRELRAGQVSLSDREALSMPCPVASQPVLFQFPTSAPRQGLLGPGAVWGGISAHPVLGLALSPWKSIQPSVVGTCVQWEGRQLTNEGEPLVRTHHRRPPNTGPSPRLHPAAHHKPIVLNFGCLLESPGQLLKTITAWVIT